MTSLSSARPSGQTPPATPETAAYLRGIVDGTVIVTAVQMAALKAAAKRAHEEIPGADVLRAFCVCGYHESGSQRPLCDLISKLEANAEVVPAPPLAREQPRTDQTTDIGKSLGYHS